MECWRTGVLTRPAASSSYQRTTPILHHSFSPPSMLRPENAGEDGFFDFPDQRHGDGHGQKDEKQEDPLTQRFHHPQHDPDGHWWAFDLGKREKDCEERRDQDQNDTVQRGEDLRLLAQRFI